MKLKFYGHACFSVIIGDKELLFDPFISPNPKAAHIDIDSVEADYILVSHAHGDHIADVEVIAKRTGATIISNYEVGEYYGQKGISDIHSLNQGGSWSFDFGKVKCVPATHSSSFPDGTYGGNPVGFVIDSPEGNFYYAGDTSLSMNMKLIPLFSKLDFAVLPIGDNYTMGIEEAVMCADFIECSEIVGVHYDTFGWIEIDQEQARNAFAAKNKTLHLLEIGGSINLN